MDIPSNLRIITSGKVPTIQTCPFGYIAFGVVDGKPRLFFNSDNNIREIPTVGESGGDSSFRPSETIFSPDGKRVTETFEGGSLSAVFNSDGSVTETLTKDGQAISLKTIFNANGSISRILV